MTVKSITLYCKSNGSNKVYKASIEAMGDGFVVNYAYGAIGSTLRTGTKTKEPVDEVKAHSIYDKLVKSKLSGKNKYVPDYSQESDYIHERDSRDTGISPQLLNPIKNDCADAFLTSNKYVMQEKYDGVRRLAKVESRTVVAINRKGLSVGESKVVIDSIKNIPSQSIIDGEVCGDMFYVFDLLEHMGKCVRHLPYLERLEILSGFDFGENARVVPTAITTANKVAMYKDCKARGAEGVVFKEASAQYVEGRPASGGAQIKDKFYKTASVVVMAHNENRRSIQMGVVSGDGQTVFVGNVTIPPAVDLNTIPTGCTVEVRYLYAYDGGSLYQPTYLGVRCDVSADECLISQLEYKQAA